MTPGHVGNPYLFPQALLLTPRFVQDAEKHLQDIDAKISAITAEFLANTKDAITDVLLECSEMAGNSIHRGWKHTTELTGKITLELVKGMRHHIERAILLGSKPAKLWLETIWKLSWHREQVATYPFCYELTDAELDFVDARMRCKLLRLSQPPTMNVGTPSDALDVIIRRLEMSIHREKFAIYGQVLDRLPKDDPRYGVILQWDSKIPINGLPYVSHEGTLAEPAHRKNIPGIPMV